MKTKTDSSPSECQKPKISNVFQFFPEYYSKYSEQVLDFSHDRPGTFKKKKTKLTTKKQQYPEKKKVGERDMGRERMRKRGSEKEKTQVLEQPSRKFIR